MDDYYLGEEGARKLVNGKVLYSEFALHCANSGVKFVSSRQSFYKKLRDLGFHAEYKRDENKTKT